MRKKHSLGLRLAVVVLLGSWAGTVSTGCAPEKSTDDANVETARPATPTTAARGTMKAGARNRMHTPATPQR